MGAEVAKESPEEEQRAQVREGLGWLEGWLRAWNSHDVEALDELITDDITWEDPAMFGEPAHGRAEFKAFAASFLRGLPDVRLQTTDPPYVATEGTRLAHAWHLSGTFTGPLARWEKRFGPNAVAFAPTGRRLNLEAVDLYELRDGRLAHWKLLYDLFDFSQQLGLIPPAGGLLTQLQVRGQRLAARWMRRRSAAAASR